MRRAYRARSGWSCAGARLLIASTHSRAVHLYDVLLRQLPHILTISRLAASPFVVWLLLRSRFEEALLITVVAGATDWLDGFLARRLRASGKLGAVLDPIADKTLLVTLFLTLGYVRLIPAWLILLVVARDVMIVVGALLLRSLRNVRQFLPSPLGKVSTFFQIVLVLVVLLEICYKIRTLFWLQRAAFASVALFTVASGADYAQRGVMMAAGEARPVR